MPIASRLLTNKPDICRIHQPKDRDVRFPFVQYRTYIFLNGNIGNRKVIDDSDDDDALQPKSPPPKAAKPAKREYRPTTIYLPYIY